MSLPPRGTGLTTGRAGERRLGQPRTEEERYLRHYGLSASNKTWTYICIGGGIILLLIGLYYLQK